jgi:hypothetical protein
MPVQSPVKPQTQTPSFTPQTPYTLPMENNGSPAKTIFDAIPLGLVMRLAKPYLAGVSSEEAIDIAHQIYNHDQYASTIDILGEDATSDEDCEATVTAYQRLIDVVKARPIDCQNPHQNMTISMKPSMFSTMAPEHGKQSDRAQEKAFDRITRVVDYALKSKVDMTLEAEDHRWTNFHLEAYFALISAGYTNLGTVLQTRLLRTEKDVVRFDERMRVRLVIGIYNEPAQIAHTDKRLMKDLAVQYAAQLLDAGAYVELASHDVKCIEHFYRYTAAPNKVPADRFEHQFLLGVPRAKVQKGLVSGKYFADLAKTMSGEEAEYIQSLEQTGAVVRMYLPYGTAKVSGAYCRRRLRENPNMITYGIKNVLGIH